MLKPTTMFLETNHLKRMTAIGKSQGLKLSQVVRVAIADYIRRKNA